MPALALGAGPVAYCAQPADSCFQPEERESGLISVPVIPLLLSSPLHNDTPCNCSPCFHPASEPPFSTRQEVTSGIWAETWRGPFMVQIRSHHLLVQNPHQ